ncbi:CBS domain-containing protein [bacterium]|nr:CBS domain-containing protein [bacterium]
MLNLTAKDIMTRDVVTVHKGSSIEEALRLMACNNISGLPVVDADGDLQGIITESDLLLKGQISLPDAVAHKNSLFAPHPDGVEEAYRRSQARLVEDAMTKRVLTFLEDSIVSDIAREMIEHAVNRVPILRGRRVVGIISRKDIIQALAKASNGFDECPGKSHKGQLIEL